MRDLSEIRKDINAIDEEIRSLFLKRMEVAEQVVDRKIETGDKILKKDREKELLETMLEQVPDYLHLEYASLLNTTMRVSRKHQYERLLSTCPEKIAIKLSPRNDNPKMVCYQGLPASYQHTAARHLFPNAEYISKDTFDDVFAAVANGETEYGIIPLENSTAGTINEVYDLLVEYELYVSHSYISKIQHCLASEANSLRDITDVYSHPQALGQCHNFIKKHNLKANAMTNTAVAADFISKLGKSNEAAICSVAAAKLYGLNILKENINDAEFNQTRFIAVTRKLTASKEDDRISVIFTLPHISGSLASALSIFSDYGTNLTEIHSRPQVDSPWTYRFYVDFSGNLLKDSTRSLLYQILQEMPYVKLLGCYSISQ